MKKALLVGGVIVGAALLARRLAGSMEGIDWEQKFEAMPDNAPPKWMFRNISTIRENTDRILELLEQREASGSAGTA